MDGPLSLQMKDINWYLSEATVQQASDLHLIVDMSPTIRIDGTQHSLPCEPLCAEEVKRLVYGLMSPEQRSKFERELELNFGFSVPQLGRFRVNVYVSRGRVEAALRAVSLRPKNPEQLGLPPAVVELGKRTSGLILVVGAAGQGKTTTLASLIDVINRGERRCRIITIEDPIEYLHESINSVIIQREVGSDTVSFQSALVQALRQDPNVLCIGEMRDLETISTALTAAETGHLVLATLHSRDTIQTIERIVDVFPAYQQPQIRLQLASSIEGIIAQRLLPRKDGTGRVLAAELLLGSLPVRNTIREARQHQLTSYLETSMDNTISELYEAGSISYEIARANMKDMQNLKAQS